MNKIKEYTEKIFEDIKHTDEEGNEYWLARELMPLLEYSKWERFSNAIEYAKTSCIKSGYDTNDHFPEVGKMVQIGSKTKRKLLDYKLSRYACYLFDNRYNYIDLLLYNIKYKCYVVVELKVTELKKEHTGQIMTYMNYIDKNVKTIDENDTEGIIICKQDNEYVIKYCSDDRIIARTYDIINIGCDFYDN